MQTIVHADEAAYLCGPRHRAFPQRALGAPAAAQRGGWLDV